MIKRYHPPIPTYVQDETIIDQFGKKKTLDRFMDLVKSGNKYFSGLDPNPGEKLQSRSNTGFFKYHKDDPDRTFESAGLPHFFRTHRAKLQTLWEPLPYFGQQLTKGVGKGRGKGSRKKSETETSPSPFNVHPEGEDEESKCISTGERKMRERESGMIIEKEEDSFGSGSGSEVGKLVDTTTTPTLSSLTPAPAPLTLSSVSPAPITPGLKRSRPIPESGSDLDSPHRKKNPPTRTLTPEFDSGDVDVQGGMIDVDREPDLDTGQGGMINLDQVHPGESRMIDVDKVHQVDSGQGELTKVDRLNSRDISNKDESRPVERTRTMTRLSTEIHSWLKTKETWISIINRSELNPDLRKTLVSAYPNFVSYISSTSTSTSTTKPFHQDIINTWLTWLTLNDPDSVCIMKTFGFSKYDFGISTGVKDQRSVLNDVFKENTPMLSRADRIVVAGGPYDDWTYIVGCIDLRDSKVCVWDMNPSEESKRSPSSHHCDTMLSLGRAIDETRPWKSETIRSDERGDGLEACMIAQVFADSGVVLGIQRILEKRYEKVDTVEVLLSKMIKNKLHFGKETTQTNKQMTDG
ncbi:hypothetical protein M231_04076 [Tremella mesenterica]|uniref:Uncharacterized protein n=1 Tax=Tremella mesenterica TaxID=5217 RepID=A0A4Q1BLJ1_TREME|nr:hypothetical protein M231_04076 [Tremella mesenterica]